MNRQPKLDSDPPDDDSPAAMAEKFRAFQRRQALASSPESPPPMTPAARTDMDMPRNTRLVAVDSNGLATSNDAWNEEWLYPVDAWTLILGIDLPYLETGLRSIAENQSGPDPALLLNELERLRGLRILPVNAEGKIRRDDAVRVAYRLGYRIEPGTPAFDILVHIHGIVPDANPGDVLPAPAQPAPEPVWMGIVQAAVAALVFFPDLAATASEADAPARILDTILDRHIFSPEAIASPEEREQAESQIRQILLIVRTTAAAPSQSC